MKGQEAETKSDNDSNMTYPSVMKRCDSRTYKLSIKSIYKYIKQYEKASLFITINHNKPVNMFWVGSKYTSIQR